MPETKSYIEFSKAVKEKYPEYNDIGDIELAKAVIKKYPEYKDMVSFENTKSTFDAGSGITGKVDVRGDTSYVHPGGSISSELPSLVYDNKDKTDSWNDKPATTANLWENMGWKFKELGLNYKGGAGELVNVVTGSQRDARKALQLLDEYGKEGVDLKNLSLPELYIKLKQNEFEKEKTKYVKDAEDWNKRHPGFLDKLINYSVFGDDKPPEAPKNPFVSGNGLVNNFVNGLLDVSGNIGKLRDS